MFNYRVNGDHLPNGILIARGPLFKRGAKIVGARLMDLAPTILHILGVPVPTDMEGKVLDDLFIREYAKEVVYIDRDTDVLSQPTLVEYSEDARARIEDRLKGLGYLD